MSVLPEGALAAIRLIISSVTAAAGVTWNFVSGTHTIVDDTFSGPTGINLTLNGDLAIIPMPAGSPAANRVLVPKLIINYPESRADFNLRGMLPPLLGTRQCRAAWQFFANNGATFLASYIQDCHNMSTGAGTETAQIVQQLLCEGTLRVIMNWNGETRAFVETLVKELPADPAVANLADGFAGIFKNTTSAAVFLAMNDGGVIKKVALV